MCLYCKLPVFVAWLEPRHRGSKEVFWVWCVVLLLLPSSSALVSCCPRERERETSEVFLDAAANSGGSSRCWPSLVVYLVVGLCSVVLCIALRRRRSDEHVACPVVATVRVRRAVRHQNSWASASP